MNPILLDIPVPIYTPRLMLRAPQAGDGAELNRAVIESLKDLSEWLSWASTKPSVEESEENIRRSSAKWILREDLRILIFDRETGLLAGSTGLLAVNWELPKFEIGYWVRSQFAGRGYITESTNALTRYAFKQLKAKRVEIRCDSKNLRSQAVIKKLGFDHEGTLRGDERSNGENLRDTLIYSRLNTLGLPPLELTW